MLDFVRGGGLGMMPVLVLALTSIGTSIALAARPSRGAMVLVVASVFTLLISGALGTLMGIRNASSAGMLDDVLGDCLAPMLAALFALGVSVPFATVGAYRLLAGDASR